MAGKLANELFSVIKNAGISFESVCSPALGGILAGYELARAGNKRFIFTERVDGQMTLRRGFEVKKGEKFIICEDVITTGGSAVSGAGNVAIYTCEKLYQFGAKPVTVSDSTGYIYDAEGIDVALLKQLKEVERVGLREYSVRKAGSKFIPVSEYKPGRNGVWDVKCDAAFPCATQNEVSLADIEVLYNNGCRLLAEGANLPSTLDAMEFMAAKSDFLYGPAKAANAGGVATSGLEMAQNAAMESWSFEKVDARLQGIMKHIFDISYETSVEFGKPGDLVLGGNIAGFRKVADAMIDQGY